MDSFYERKLRCKCCINHETAENDLIFNVVEQKVKKSITQEQNKEFFKCKSKFEIFQHSHESKRAYTRSRTHIHSAHSLFYFSTPSAQQSCLKKRMW